jgi:hypothetical protein
VCRIKKQSKCLKIGEEVVLLYRQDEGFVYQKGKCIDFTERLLNNNLVQIPTIEVGDSYLNGDTCFWLRPCQIDRTKTAEELHREIYELNQFVCEISDDMNKIKPEHDYAFFVQSREKEVSRKSSNGV